MGRGRGEPIAMPAIDEDAPLGLDEAGGSEGSSEGSSSDEEEEEEEAIFTLRSRRARGVAGGARGVVQPAEVPAELAVPAAFAAVLEESARLAAEIRQQLVDSDSGAEEPAPAPAPAVAPTDATLTAGQAQEHPWGCSKCRWWAGCKKCKSEELQLLLHKQDWRQMVMAGRARVPKGKK